MKWITFQKENQNNRHTHTHIYNFNAISRDGVKYVNALIYFDMLGAAGVATVVEFFHILCEAMLICL